LSNAKKFRDRKERELDKIGYQGYLKDLKKTKELNQISKEKPKQNKKKETRVRRPETVDNTIDELRNIEDRLNRSTERAKEISEIKHNKIK